MSFTIGGDRSPDKMRLCPSCRMEISVLATRCRFCGEEVGRPKEEQRHLTVDELGGETIEHYAPSSSVMEALESFRSDETVRGTPNETKKKSSIFRKRPGDKEPEAKKDSGLPELDANSRKLADTFSSGPSNSRARSRKSAPASPSWMKIVGVFAGLSAAMVIIYFGGIQVMAIINSSGSDDIARIPGNPALSYLEEGDSLEALRQASKFESHYDTPDSRDVLKQARDAVQAEVMGLLTSAPYTKQNLREASRIVQEAHAADPSEPMLGLKELVDKELRDYALKLTSIDLASSPRQATFTVTGSNQAVAEITVAQGDTFLDGRFKLESVTATNGVKLVDLKRDQRRLQLTQTGQLRAI